SGEPERWKIPSITTAPASPKTTCDSPLTLGPPNVAAVACVFSPLLWNSDVDRVALDMHGIDGNIIACRAAQYLAGAHIELRGVHGAREDTAGKLPVAQAAADVRAVVAHGVDDAADLG